jgi:prepilin-type N-terminal cleavage/methylation domain-containing protein
MRAPATVRSRAARGFTIIEVMVALSAGVLVSMAAFMLSKNATAFFQREVRVSSAQLALNLAMNRLTSDIQRASFLSTPNIQADPSVCRTQAATWPAGLGALTGINIVSGTATAQGNAQSPAMVAPDQIIIGGSMDASEVFQVQSIVPGTGGAPLLVMRIPTGEPATYRALASEGGLAANLPCKLKPWFAPSTFPASAPLPPTCTPPISSGRFAQIYQPETNTRWFGVIDTFTINQVTGAINVQLLATPVIPQKPGDVCGIGLGDTGGGWLFSVVSRVQYDIRSLVGTTSQYGVLVNTPAAQAQATGDAGRTELVRTELDATGAQIAASMELVAEYAVDMRFGITVASLITGDNYTPTVTDYLINDSNVYTVTANTPQRVRAVQVRLSTRTRAPDRDTDLPPGPDGRRLRFLVDASLQPAYARVRTNYASVALPNQGGFSLW